MKMSQLFGQTLRDTPADAEASSHSLLLRAGFIRPLGTGIFSYLHLAKRSMQKIEAILRDPYDGIGKPEPLKYLAPGVWSRRLTQEHRIVYLVRDDQIDFLQARYHY